MIRARPARVDDRRVVREVDAGGALLRATFPFRRDRVPQMPRQPLLVAGACALLWLTACASSGTSGRARAEAAPAPAPPPARDAGGDGRTHVYRCADGLGFGVRVLDERVWLFLPGTTLELPQVPAASGTKYASGSTVFWSEGEEATLERDGTTHAGCLLDHGRSDWDDARRRGVDFRAVGHEPGWLLEIWEGQRIALVTSGGNVRHELPAPRPHVHEQAGETTYLVRRGAHAWAIVIEQRSCHDPLSDEELETTVTVGVDGDALRGCGRPLR
jgi:membrane-bound inhibitor of C-type lysozyme/uncharacterized membrane protein